MKFSGKYFFPAVAFFLMLVTACRKDPPIGTGTGLQIITMKIGSLTIDLSAGATNTEAPVDQPIVVSFSEALDVATVSKSFFLVTGNDTVPLGFSFADQDKTVTATPAFDLESLTTYTIIMTSGIKSPTGKSFSGLTVSFTTTLPNLEIVSVTVGGKNLLQSGRTTDVDRNFSSVIKFNIPVNPATANSSSIVVSTSGAIAQLSFTFSDSNKTISLSASQPLVHFARYVLTITGNLKGVEGNVFTTFTKEFFTALDTTPKFPVISDDDLLTLVEQQTFKYFWDFGHPASGMARERNVSGDIVTTGGSGFGVMSMIVGIQRNFITRSEGLGRLDKILTFLETCDRFHGAFPHWMNGNTGTVEPFGMFDDGADIVETSYMMQGLLTFRQFLNPLDAYETTLIDRINALWNAVEWDWFTKDGQENILFWNWSPNYGFAVNVPVVGWNEALITYFLAAASGTHSIDAEVYTEGWAGGSAFINGNSYYGYTLPLGSAYGGPLFFSHYSFLGMNPHNLSDAYANYWTQVVNHTEINRAYCIDNPNNYVGYSSQNWGLTASDNQSGYTAHSPTNDLGVIAPTAALSSMPYTPEESMDALKFFYYTIGDKTWGPYGFYDAFNTSAGWYGTSDLAIDEGPIIVMIENYRTGLLWNLFMSAPEVTAGMDKLGFTN